jgi:hypothetical protein
MGAETPHPAVFGSVSANQQPLTPDATRER